MKIHIDDSSKDRSNLTTYVSDLSRELMGLKVRSPSVCVCLSVSFSLFLSFSLFISHLPPSHLTILSTFSSVSL